MTTQKLNIGQKVVKSANKYNTEFYSGIIKDLRSDKALVNFTDRGFSRWCNVSNLETLS